MPLRPPVGLQETRGECRGLEALGPARCNEMGTHPKYFTLHSDIVHTCLSISLQT